jgi:hypothetical protein
MKYEDRLPVEDRPLIRPPKYRPAFGCKAWANTSTCADVHPNGPIPKGSLLCCMACHKGGKEGHPGLKRDPFTDPKPEAKASDVEERTSKPAANKPETRRERRARQYSAIVEAAIIKG